MPGAWVRMVEEREADGIIKSIYDGFLKQRGWVPHILKVQGLRPQTLRAMVQLVGAVMYDPSSGLTRAQREMMATVVSATNRCQY